MRHNQRFLLFFVPALILFLLGAILVTVRQTLAQETKRQPSHRIAQQNEQMGFRGVITGTVRRADGLNLPIADVLVRARFVRKATGAQGEGSAYTDAMGRYEIRGLSSQEFAVSIEPELERTLIPSAYQRVDLRTIARVDNIDFTVEDGPLITVRVRDAETDAPIPQMAINSSGTFRRPLPYGVTDSNGETRFRMPFLQDYLRLEPVDKAQRNKIEAAPGFNFGKSIDLKKSAGIVWEVRTYRMPGTYDKRTYSGTVLDESNRPVARARVSIKMEHEDTTAFSNADGRFTFQARRPRGVHVAYKNLFNADITGSLFLRAEKRGLRGEVLPKPSDFWKPLVIRVRGDAAAAASPQEAQTGASLFGVVVDLDGKTPLAGVPVYCEQRVPYSVSSNSATDLRQITDAAGRFRFDRLSTELRTMLFLGSHRDGNPPYGKAIYPRREARPSWLKVDQDYQLSHTAPFVLQENEQHDAGTIVVPRATSFVAGKIINAAGKPVIDENITVSVRGKYTEESGRVAADGTFHIDTIVPERESLRLFVFYCEGGFCRTSPGNSDESARAKVRAGDTNIGVKVKPRPANLPK